MTTLFSHAIRILTCQRCGAPLEAAVEGGSIVCAYCQATNDVAQRDESRDAAIAAEGRASAMSESERYASLRAQDRAPTIPEALDALLDGAALRPDQVAAAQAEWKNVRPQAKPGAPFHVHEKLFHLTLALGPHVDARWRRAMYETALEVLDDADQRQVLRSLLARDAVLAGDAAGAEAWLAAVNPRPTELRADSAHRITAATRAIAGGDHATALGLLGDTVSDVPMATAFEPAAAVLRAGLLEASGRRDAATEQTRAALKGLENPQLTGRDMAVDTAMTAIDREADAFAPLGLPTGGLCAGLAAEIVPYVESLQRRVNVLTADAKGGGVLLLVALMLPTALGMLAGVITLPLFVPEPGEAMVALACGAGTLLGLVVGALYWLLHGRKIVAETRAEKMAEAAPLQAELDRLTARLAGYRERT